MRSFLTAILCFPYPEERAAGARLEGRTYGGAARRDNPGSAAKSPLFSSPALDLPLGGHGILYPVEVLMEDKGYRPTACCIAVKRAGLMLCDPLVEAAARCASVVRAVGAAQNVEPGAHAARPATARSISASKLAAIA